MENVLGVAWQPGELLLLLEFRYTDSATGLPKLNSRTRIVQDLKLIQHVSGSPAIYLLSRLRTGGVVTPHTRQENAAKHTQ